jgi:acetyl-CoA carboxylase beta subunit
MLRECVVIIYYHNIQKQSEVLAACAKKFRLDRRQQASILNIQSVRQQIVILTTLWWWQVRERLAVNK